MVAGQRGTGLLADKLLVAALAEREEERERERASEEPRREADAEDRRAGHGAQHEARGDDDDVDVRKALQKARIADLHETVAEYDGDHRPPIDMAGEHHEGRQETERKHKAGHEGGRPRHDKSCGNRAVPLHGMEAVRRQVADVVEEVERGRNETEAREHAGHQHKRTPALGHLTLRGVVGGKEPGHWDEDVLGPLLHTQGAQPGLDRGEFHSFIVLQRIRPQSSEWSV